MSLSDDDDFGVLIVPASMTVTSPSAMIARSMVSASGRKCLPGGSDRAVALDVELQFGGCCGAKDVAYHNAKGRRWAG